MTNTAHNPTDVFPPYANYAHAVEVAAGARTLYVSGLNGYEVDGRTMPANVELLKTHLGTHKAARTVICAKLLEPDWLIELEAIAASGS